jgi:hypothetical protein
MSSGEDGGEKRLKGAGATEAEIRAHLLRKLKEALPKVREANRKRPRKE